MTMFELFPLTWTCHICDRTRNDKDISVADHDLSHEWDLPTGHVLCHVRYCNDYKDCEVKAKDPNYPHHGQAGQDCKVKKMLQKMKNEHKK